MRRRVSSGLHTVVSGEASPGVDRAAEKSLPPVQQAIRRLLPFEVRVYHFILLPAVAMAAFIWISRRVDYLAIPWFMQQGMPDVYLALRSAVIGALMATLIAILAIRYKSGYERELWSRNRALEETRDFLSRVIEGSAEAIITRDENGRVTAWNRAAERIYGWTAAEIKGKKLDVLLPDDVSARDAEARRRRLESGETVRNYETERVRKDGKRITVRVTTAPLLAADERFAGTVGIVRDVTELKEMEALLVERERLAAVGELAAMVAHEVRNPLAGIRGGCEILLEGYPEGDARHEIGEEILRQVDRLNGTVHELLLYARPKALDPVPTDVHLLLDRVVRNGTEARKPSSVEVSRQYATGLPSVELDARQMEQVFLNLFLNACQVQSDPCRVRLSTEISQGEFQVTVRDWGPGISPERMESIFKPFYTTRAQGTGLGLAVVKKIVEAHRGSVEARNCPDLGAEFVVRLPLRQEQA